MEITVNGKPVRIAENMRLAQFIEVRGFQPSAVIVEYNHEIVKAETWESILLNPKDTLEIVTFVGGG